MHRWWHGGHSDRLISATRNPRPTGLDLFAPGLTQIFLDRNQEEPLAITGVGILHLPGAFLQFAFMSSENYRTDSMA